MYVTKKSNPYDPNIELSKSYNEGQKVEDNRKPNVNRSDEDVDQNEKPSHRRKEILRILRAFGDMTKIYFYEESKGRCMFLVLVILMLLNSAVRVFFSYLARDFWKLLKAVFYEQSRDSGHQDREPFKESRTLTSIFCLKNLVSFHFVYFEYLCLRTLLLTKGVF